MTKLLYLPTGEFLSFLRTGSVSIHIPERTLIVEESIYYHTDRVFDFLCILKENISREIFIDNKVNNLKFPVLKEEIVICE